jgi:excisionase family DNA binding protein
MPRKAVESVNQTAPAREPLLVTVPEAARLLSLSPWTIRTLVRKGVLVAKRLSRSKWLVTYRSISNFANVKATT